MFDSSNKTAMEVVLHFLLSALDPVKAAETFKYVPSSTNFVENFLFIPLMCIFRLLSFRFCWPILDHLQDKAFRKAASDWLKSIAEVK